MITRVVLFFIFSVLISDEVSLILGKVKQTNYFTLENGVRVVLLNETHSPTFASVVAIKVGSIDEPVGKKGISHLFEHLAFKGTKTVGTKNYDLEKSLLDRAWLLESKLIKGKITKKEQLELKLLREKLKEISKPEEFMANLANLGGIDLNAYTSADFTVYTGRYPSESLSRWINLEVDRLINPVPRQFYEEVRVIFQERSMRIDNNPLGKMYEHIIFKSFPDHPYRYPVIGYKEHLMQLTPQDLLEFHRQNYYGSNIVFVIIGNVSNDDFEKIIKPELLKIPNTGKIPTQLNSVKRFPNFMLEKKNFGTKAIMAAFKKGVYPDPEDICASVVARILFDERHGKLFKSLVESKNIFTSVSYFEAPGFRDSNIILVNLPVFQNINSNDAIDELLAFIEKVSIQEEDLMAAKRLILKDISKLFEDRLSLATFLGELTLLHGKPDEVIKIMIQMLSLNLDDAINCKSQVFRKNNLLILSSEK